MRKFAMVVALGGLFGMAFAAACGGSDDTTSGGSGGAGGAVASTGAAPMTMASSGAGGQSGCIEVKDVKGFGAANQNLFAGVVDPAFGGADDDLLGVFVSKAGVAKTTLALPANMDACGDTDACVLVVEDSTMDGAAATYVAKSGSLDITKFDGKYLVTGSLSDVTLTEVTVDQMGVVAAVDGGKCVHVASFAFDIQPPVTGWTCNPSYYDETKQGAKDVFCDCNCGAVDPDCANAANEIDGCEAGQTCGAKATCEGVPSAWTCPKDQYNGGKGNGCDCGCGTVDPDCKLDPAEKVDGCMAGDKCDAGKCLPAGWKCSAEFYDEDKAGPTDKLCDCGCGVKDPDCADGKLASCNFCDDDGSCSMAACKDNKDIKADDNAVCIK